MSSKDIKALRGQLRQIIKELLPEILSTEVSNSIHKSVSFDITARLDSITKSVTAALEKMDNRSLDMQNYIIRNTNVPVAPIRNDLEVKG